MHEFEIGNEVTGGNSRFVTAVTDAGRPLTCREWRWALKIGRSPQDRVQASQVRCVQRDAVTRDRNRKSGTTKKVVSLPACRNGKPWKQGTREGDPGP